MNYQCVFNLDPAYITSTTESASKADHLFIAKIGVIAGGAFLGVLALTVLILCLIYHRSTRKRGKRYKRYNVNVIANESWIYM